MADQLYIANAALDLVGQGTILSLDDGTPTSKKCKLHIRPAIAEALEMGKWKCAKAQKQLARLTAAPAFGYTLAYQLPDDYVRCVTFNDYDPDNWIKPLYDIQGKQLLTDETFADLCYVKDLSAPGNDISAATPQLVALMAVILAQKMAWGFTQSRSLKESLEQEAAMRLRKALAKDAKETRKVLVNPASESTWIQSRFSSTAG